MSGSVNNKETRNHRGDSFGSFLAIVYIALQNLGLITDDLLRNEKYTIVHERDACRV